MNTVPASSCRPAGLAGLALAALVLLLAMAPGAPAQEAQDTNQGMDGMIEPGPAGLETSGVPLTDPPGRVARLGYIEGDVSMMAAGSDDWTQAVLNRPFTRGDRLWVDGDGRAELQMGSSRIYLDQETGFGFLELDDDVAQMSLTEGAATIRVQRLGRSETIQIETPNATVLLRRPGEYHLVIDTAGDRSIVKTRSGEAQVLGGGRADTIGANQVGTFSGLDELSVSFAPLPPRNEFETWANERDRRAEQAVSSRYVSRDVIGYEDLDDQGEWISEPGYGPVWRPLYVASDWAPYRYGHWSWISPWGWTWVDDARWGFAPFHYGRWAHVRNRWCWVPGPRHLRPVYAPALVGWMGGPSLGVSIGLGAGVGWFPLAPHEVYRPWYRHTPRHIRRINDANTLIIDRTRMTDRHRGARQGSAYRHGHSGAVTFVRRDRFSGHPVAPNRLTVDRRDLHQWHGDGRAPRFTPTRDRLTTGHLARRHPSMPGDGPRNAQRPGDAQRPHPTDRRTHPSVSGLPDRRSTRFDTHAARDSESDRPGANRSSPSIQPGLSSRRPSSLATSSPPVTALAPREQHAPGARAGRAGEWRSATERPAGANRRFEPLPPAAAGTTTRTTDSHSAGRHVGAARPSGNTLTTRPQNGRAEAGRLNIRPAPQANRTGRPSLHAGESSQRRYGTTGLASQAGTATTRSTPPARTLDSPRESRSAIPPRRAAPRQPDQDRPSHRSAPRQRQPMDASSERARSGNASSRSTPRSAPRASRPATASPPSRSSPRPQKN